ncbi:MAG: CHAT domain-containing protein, partial [Anaerolineae bacterium]
EREANLGRAIEAYRQALTVYTPETAPLEYATTQNNLGNAYSDLAQVREREANLGRAIEAYRQALTMIDRFFLVASVTAQVGLQQEWAGLTARAVEAHRQAGQAPQALTVAEGSKSRLLTALLGRGDLPVPSAIPQDLAAQERELADRLAALDAADLARHGQPTPAEEEAARLQRLEQRLDVVKRLQTIWQEMEEHAPEAQDYIALRRGDRPSWEVLARLAADLGPGTALLSLFTTGQRILFFVLRAGWDAPQVVETALTPDELRYVYLANYWDEVLDRRAHRAVGRPLTGRWRGLGRPLLSPALPWLEGVTHLVIAPESLLHLLPLHALDLDGHGETLLDRCAVSYIPALGLLDRLRRRKPIAAGKAVVLGYTPADATTERGRSEQELFRGEARAVAGQMGVRPLLDGEATAQRLQEILTGQTLRLVHLSCHGRFDPQDPLRSGVLLADGPFTARQWMGLRGFRADLVTLSACQTALTGSLGGDELAGLSQALLYAGASSLLVGLWSVNAATTAALMVDFYRRLWDDSGNKKTDEATALREAALALREGRLLPSEEGFDLSDPYYWAPFILVGDWR